MKTFNLDAYNVQAITNEESMVVYGGSFWGDLGYAVGYVLGSYLKSCEDHPGMSETMMNCI